MHIIIVDAELPKGIEQVVTPYPPTPIQSIMFYGSNTIQAQKDEKAGFEKQPPIVVIGPQYSRVDLMVNNKLKAIRVDFRPGGLYRLLKIPMHELFDDGFNASSLLGYEMDHLNERILNAHNMEAAKNIVEEYLLKKRVSLSTALPLDVAMFELMRSNGSISMEKIASISCLSLRQFERKCKERIGMSPKPYARIARFSKAYRLRESSPTLSWTSIAYEAGYFDQMHMIRDFKEFTGVTPTILESALNTTPFRMQAGLI
jgi:AraC-like DNA-binding protein